MVQGIDNSRPNDGYNKVTLYDEKSKQTKTYLVPVGKIFTYGGNEYNIDKAKNKEIVFKGKNEKDSRLNLMGLALEKMDVNKDGKIDNRDNDPNIAQKLNDKELKDSAYFVKNNDAYSDAGVHKGEGGVVYSKKDTNEQTFGINIE